MSDNNRFFRWVWRFNAIVLLAVAGFAAVLIGGRMWQPEFDPLHLAPPSAATLLDAIRKASPQSSYTLDAIFNAADPSSSEQLYALSKPFDVTVYDPGDPVSGARTVNILVMNAKTKTTRWLFEGNNHAILSTAVLFKPAPVVHDSDSDIGGSVLGLVMVIVDADSDKDGKLSGRDRQSLYFYRLDGKSPIKLLAADRIFGSQPVNQPGHYQVLYQNGRDTFAATYALPDFNLVAKTAIKNMPKLISAFGVNTSIESIVVTGIR